MTGFKGFFFHPSIFVIIKLDEKRFCNWININIIKKIVDTWVGATSFRWHVQGDLMAKWCLLGWQSNSLDGLSIPKRHLWRMNIQFGVSNLFFFFSFPFSLWFLRSNYKFSKQSFNFFSSSYLILVLFITIFSICNDL